MLVKYLVSATLLCVAASNAFGQVVTQEFGTEEATVYNWSGSYVGTSAGKVDITANSKYKNYIGPVILKYGVSANIGQVFSIDKTIIKLPQKINDKGSRRSAALNGFIGFNR